MRAGGNVNLSRETSDADVRKEIAQVSSDLRVRVLFDNIRYLGTAELLLQDNFSKERGRPFSVASDIAEFRTTWIRRLNQWLGPYIRGTVDTHFFNRTAATDTIFIARTVDSSGTPVTRLFRNSAGDFLIAPAFDPMNFKEGLGVNVELLSKYYLDISAFVKDAKYWEANFGATLPWLRPAAGDKGIYGFMSQLTMTGPYVNKTLFEQAKVPMPGPKATWEEWADATRKVAKANQMPAAMAWDRSGHRFAGPAIGYGAKIFDAKGDLQLDDGYKAAVNKFVAWHKDGTKTEAPMK